MKILIVGGGGREHALLWKLHRDAPDAEFYISGGNGGIAGLAEAAPYSAAQVEPLAVWAAEQRIDLTVVGPEAPLAAGLADVFAERGLPVFGPSAAAAEIESSKAFAKGLMRKHGIPSADYRTFSDFTAAEAYIRERGAPIVVKASGLAAGKGAVVCETEREAVEAARAMLVDESFGGAGAEIVVEEFMSGEELSVFALCDGERVLPMLPSQDHKRIGEGDTGPNTGGMGAYAPVALATRELRERILREVLQPTVDAMAAEGRPFRGLLYAGLMLTEQGPRVVEFNCRFGDPETQVVLPLLRGSLLEPMLRIARGESLAGTSLEWSDGAAVTTVLASGGYPGDYEKGFPIEIPPAVHEADDLIVFHAGTALSETGLITAGGRVLAVTALAETVSAAAERSRWGAEHIRFAGRQFRRDIGWREAERNSAG